jgi:hypothetical protein
MEENEFYTYAYLREDRTPYYIGKGKGNRCYRNGNRNCSTPVDRTKILILKRNLTEREAFRHEIYMIAVFGRKSNGTGILQNLNEGGEGQSGFKFPEESVAKMRLFHNSRPEHLNNNLRDWVKENPEHQSKAFARLLEINPDHQSEAGKLGGSVRASQESFKAMSQNNLQLINNTLWVDPDHPELGHHRAGHLVRKQKKMGYPYNKENRVQVITSSNNV